MLPFSPTSVTNTAASVPAPRTSLVTHVMSYLAVCLRLRRRTAFSAPALMAELASNVALRVVVP